MAHKIIDATNAPRLLDYKESANLCGIKKTLWYSLNASGRIPAPIRLGHRVLWARDELEGWIKAGCPNRKAWEKMKSAYG